MHSEAAEEIPQVLVVDDDPVSGMMLEGILRKEGFSVVRATSGPAGRAIAERLHPTLILLDINMPEEDGLVTCAALKAATATADIPVVFISAVEEVTAKVEGFKVGGVDYITKPYHPAEVLARVRLHIRLQQAYRVMVASFLAQLKPLEQAQQMLLASPQELPEARFAVIYQPHQHAGGDFYDVFRAGDGIFDYLVADVSGHDVGTALATPALKALVRQNAAMLYSPLENLQLLNRHIRSVLSDGQYATLIYARYHRQRRRLTLVNAGHPNALLLRVGGQAESVSLPGDVMGVFDSAALEPQEFDLQPGDRLFLFSDGLIEQDRTGAVSRRTGLAGLQSLCLQLRSLSLTDQVTAMVEQALPVRAAVLDDIVLLGMEA